jgi:TonB-dependent starch-binding outer membrane protein SusC
VFFFGVGDFNIYNKQRASLSSMNDQDLGNNKLVDYAQNHWTLENASTTYVRVDPNNINKNDQISTFWIENGSFLRIKDLQIGYKFTPVVCKALGISSFRIYANASNLYCFTAYKGIDPEAYMSGTPSSSGVDGGGYTVPRSYSCGLQIGF